MSKGTHVIFIGGIISEVLKLRSAGHYFVENAYLLENHLTGSNVDIFYPSSLKSSRSTAVEIYQYLNKAFHKSKKPLTICAHSKGAIDLLMCLKIFPEVYKSGMIGKVVFMHGALNGSSLYDLVFNSPNRIINGIVQTVTGPVRKWEGLHSLSSDSIVGQVDLIEGALRSFLLKNAVYVVGANIEGRAHIAPLKVTQKLLNSRDVNDGLLCMSDQIIPSLKLRTFFYESDHGEYYISSPYSKRLLHHKRELSIDLVNITLGKKTSVLKEISFESTLKTKVRTSLLDQINSYAYLPR